jgi:hypothetical protein
MNHHVRRTLYTCQKLVNGLRVFNCDVAILCDHIKCAHSALQLQCHCVNKFSVVGIKPKQTYTMIYNKNLIKLLSIQSLLCYPAARATSMKLPLEAVEGRRSIVFDFDGTITQRDTIGAIAHHAISHWLRRGRLVAPPGVEEEARSKWKEIVDEYMAEYNLHVSSYSPAADERRQEDQEEAFLESLRDVELYRPRHRVYVFRRPHSF